MITIKDYACIFLYGVRNISVILCIFMHSFRSFDLQLFPKIFAHTISDLCMFIGISLGRIQGLHRSHLRAHYVFPVISLGYAEDMHLYK